MRYDTIRIFIYGLEPSAEYEWPAKHVPKIYCVCVRKCERMRTPEQKMRKSGKTKRKNTERHSMRDWHIMS